MIAGKIRRQITIDTKKLALRIAGIGKDKKAEEPLILDMRKASNFCDYFVILSGTSLRQTKAIADAIEQDLNKDGIKPLAVPSKQETPWVLLDFSAVVVHVFYKPMRQFYSLERLWQDAPRVRLASARPRPSLKVRAGKTGARTPKKKNERKKP